MARSAAITFALALLFLLTASAVSAQAQDRTAPTPPGNLRVTGTTATSVSLAWNPSTDNSGSLSYIVRMGLQTRTVPQTQASFTWTELQPNTNYSFRVAARDAAGNVSANSNTVSARTPRAPANSPPTTPTNLRVTAVTMTSASFAWDPSTDSGSFSYVLVKDGQSFTVPGTQPAYTVDWLSPGHTYSFFVKAVDSGLASSGNSNTVTVTTLADTTPPTAPVLTAAVLGPSQLSLSWTASTDNNFPGPGYRIVLNGATATSHVNWWGERSVVLRHLAPATAYTVAVEAVDGAGNRAVSDSVTLTTQASSDTTPPTAPTNLRIAENQGCAEVWLAWTQATDNVDPQSAIEYEIYVNGELSPLAVSAGVDRDFVYGTVAGQNTFTVKAVDRTGNTSAPSNAVSDTLWPC